MNVNSKAVPNKSNPGKLAYILQFQPFGINGTKFDTTQIHFDCHSLIRLSSMLNLQRRNENRWFQKYRSNRCTFIRTDVGLGRSFVEGCPRTSFARVYRP